ncbi:MAG: hypothetical protein WC350_05755 [Candidatus Micrarchaeia archaeon]|jgi:hypothetical protein
MFMLLSLELITPFAGALLLLVLSIVALAYALGSLLSNDQMKAWARIELVEVFYTAVILAMMVFLVTLADDSIAGLINSSHPYVANGAISQTGFCTHLGGLQDYRGLPCHIAVGKSFFSTLFDESSMYLYDMLRDYNRMAYLASIGFNMDTILHSTGGLSFSPFAAYLQMPIGIYNYLFDFGVRSLMLIKSQEILLVFVNASVFPVFISVGIALRAFPAFRKLGGLMMGIALSMYYVFPAFYVLGSYILSGMMMAQFYESPTHSVNIMDAPFIDFDAMKIGDTGKSVADLIPNPTVTQDASGGVSMDYGGQHITQADLNSGKLIYLNASGSDICKPTTDRVSGFDAGDEWIKFVKLLAEIGTFPISGFMTGEKFDQWIFGDNGIINSMARMIFFSLFFSFLAVMSTIAAIKNISPMLGGDTEIAGLTHLV